MDYQDNQERGQKIKIIAIASAIAVVVLALGAFLVISAISGTNDKQAGANNTTLATENTDKKSTKSDDKTVAVETPAASPRIEETDTAPVVETVPATTSDVPTTGPADLFPVAILAGVAVYLLTFKLTTRKA